MISAGKTTQVDVGQVNGRTFINNSSLGIYPEIVVEREQRHRRGLNKWIALAMSMAAVLKRYPFIDVRVEVAGEQITCKTPFVFIGSNEYEIQGLNIGWRRDLHAGRLYIYLSAPVSRAGLRNGGQRPDRTSRYVENATTFSHDCQIDSRRRRVPVSLDGEYRRSKRRCIIVRVCRAEGDCS